MTHFRFPLIPQFVPLYALLLFGLIGPILLIVLVEIFNSKLYPCSKKNEKVQTRLKKVKKK